MIENYGNIDTIANSNEYYLQDYIGSHYKTYDIRDVNYKIQLLSGKKLHPVFTFDKTGLLINTVYYADYVDDSNKGVEVLTVENNYIIDPNEPILSAASVVERTTTRKWRKRNGDYVDALERSSNKKYDTRDKKNKEGEKRRKNLRRMTENEMGTALVLTGQASDPVDAEEKLTSFFEDYSSSFYTWDASGKGTIYDDIDSDTNHSWMNTVVDDNPTNQFMIPEAVGKTIREFSRDKLKGLI